MPEDQQQTNSDKNKYLTGATNYFVPDPAGGERKKIREPQKTNMN